MRDLVIGAIKTTIAVSIVLAAFTFANASVIEGVYDCTGTAICVVAPLDLVIEAEANSERDHSGGRCDVNRDQQVSAVDALIVLKEAVGTDTGFCHRDRD